jgi:hypothetical protein
VALTSMTLAKSAEHQVGWRLICDGLTRFQESQPGTWQVHDVSTGERWVLWLHEVSPDDDHVHLPVEPKVERLGEVVQDVAMAEDESWVRAMAMNAAASFCAEPENRAAIWRYVAEFEAYIRSGTKPGYGVTFTPMPPPAP